MARPCQEGAQVTAQGAAKLIAATETGGWGWSRGFVIVLQWGRRRAATDTGAAEPLLPRRSRASMGPSPRSDGDWRADDGPQLHRRASMEPARADGEEAMTQQEFDYQLLQWSSRRPSTETQTTLNAIVLRIMLQWSSRRPSTDSLDHLYNLAEQRRASMEPPARVDRERVGAR